ncbi:hypothetical protein CAEBREN_11108 [Caenorhabditis brenneri]|uniref:Uncharacterized protein n=1 Tax=Caenorhabditis brenneri TaxID=135651 RepID=G0MPA9_CAEBE|nr:hypothetical protein CAEBREN_11108 [Caenorhabditis brenneri]
MSFDSSLIEEYDCRHVVIVRWTQSDISVIAAPAAVVAFIETVGYSVGNKTVLSINLLIEVNGIRLRDVTDFMKMSQDNFTNSELLDLLMITIRLELPERLSAIESGFDMIKKGVEELVESASCEMFGSFPSKVRRNGYSDIDINIQPNMTSGKVRPLKELLANPTSVISCKLTSEELRMYPPEDIIRILYHCFHSNEAFRKEFDVRYVPARTPILVFQSNKQGKIKVSYDVSVYNHIGVDKANLLDEFIMKDKSKDNKMKNSMLFITHWARSNKLLSGAYEEEKLKTKTNLNSYIFNQLIIHFIQAAAAKILVHPQAKYGSRVDEFNFDELFSDHCKFLKEFFKYYASFDFTNKAIYGKQAMQKTTLLNVHGAKVTPLMIMDPMDCTHNISAKVTDDAVKLLNGLIRNTLYILKQKPFHLNYLLETNRIAVAMMKNKETKITVTSKLINGIEKNLMSVQLPEVIRSAEDLMLLLTRVLRFDVNPHHEGPSVPDLNNPGGAIFNVHAKTWIGRRNIKRQLKNTHKDLSPLQVDVMTSDVYQYEDPPVAVLKVCFSAKERTTNLEIIIGNVAEVRDAMHFLMDQFVLNNLEFLMEHGIQSISNIPTTELPQS